MFNKASGFSFYEEVNRRIFAERKTIEGVLKSLLACLLSVPLLLDGVMALRRSCNVPMWTKPFMFLAWTLVQALPNVTLDVI